MWYLKLTKSHTKKVTNVTDTGESTQAKLVHKFFFTLALGNCSLTEQSKLKFKVYIHQWMEFPLDLNYKYCKLYICADHFSMRATYF